MEVEEAIKHWKNNLDKWKKDRPDLSNTEIVEEVDYDYKAIETLLNHITKQEKMIQLLIDDLQGEGCLKMTREEIDKYYEKRIKLQDNEI